MRKKIKIAIPVIFILAIGFMIYKISVTQIEKENNKERIKQLPSFTDRNILDRRVFSTDNIEKVRPVLISFFHPNCDHCKSQAGEIKNNIASLNKFVILMISSADNTEIKSFSDEFGLSNQINIIFIEDKNLKYSELFEISGIPTNLVYNKHKELVNEFKGEVETEELLKYLNQFQ